MTTRVLSAHAPAERAIAVTEAVTLLRNGEVAALPTETVYGLAADALNDDAALKIFEAKERPRFDPLIVHLPDESWVTRVAIVSEEARDVVRRLIERFWPGPLTLVLPRQRRIPDVVTAGLETVAMRVSVHPVFREIVTSFGSPLAAPSANRFGRISPTTAQHVRAELDGRIPLIIDAGPTKHGLESTIVAVREGGLQILRHGPVTMEELCEFGRVSVATLGTTIEAPGQLASHYAPRTPLRLVRVSVGIAAPRERTGVLRWSSEDPREFAMVRTLSRSGEFREAASNLFRCLRELDEAELELIVAEEAPDIGLGVAINDRLRRAAAKS